MGVRALSSLREPWQWNRDALDGATHPEPERVTVHQPKPRGCAVIRIRYNDKHMGSNASRARGVGDIASHLVHLLSPTTRRGGRHLRLLVCTLSIMCHVYGGIPHAQTLPPDHPSRLPPCSCTSTHDLDLHAPAASLTPPHTVWLPICVALFWRFHGQNQPYLDS